VDRIWEVIVRSEELFQEQELDNQTDGTIAL
jgi:hypothetical protein